MESSFIYGAGGGGGAVNFTPAKLKIVCMWKVAISAARTVRAAPYGASGTARSGVEETSIRRLFKQYQLHVMNINQSPRHIRVR